MSHRRFPRRAASRRIVTSLGLALALAAPAFGEGSPAARQVVVQFAPGIAVHVDRVGDRVGDRVATGVPAVDALLARFGVSDVVPLIPPRRTPHRNPAAFVAAGLDRYWRVTPAAGVDLRQAAAAFARLKEVESASPPIVARIDNSPNDPSFNSQWSLQNGVMNMPKAWNIETDATGVPVAVIDTGADQNHADFQTNRWDNVGEIGGNGIDDDGNGYVDDKHGFDFANRDSKPDDDNGHGTHVSGTVAAIGDNATNVAGVCWVGEVMSCKALDSSGAGFLSDVAEALVYAADNGALVANMSLGSTSGDNSLKSAVDYAGDADVVMCAAAGNSSSTTPEYPAAYAKCLAVIATDENDRKASFSNYGDWCDIAAPGNNILNLKKGGGTTTMSGTSMASPHVAGLAALVRKVNPALGRAATSIVLRFSAVDLGSPGFDNSFAWGRIDGEAALKMARALTAPADVVQDGTKIDLSLKYTDDPGFIYVLLPSTTGRDPGIALSGYDPNDARFIPVNADPLQPWVVTHPNNGVFLGFVGNLDAGGKATATFNVPNHLFVGKTFNFAYLTIDPNDLAHIVHVSNPTTIDVQ